MISESERIRQLAEACVEARKATEEAQHFYADLIAWSRKYFGRWLKPERIRTGIAPKHNRNRKKQRLTRLQRRQKRQRQ